MYCGGFGSGVGSVGGRGGDRGIGGVCGGDGGKGGLCGGGGDGGDEDGNIVVCVVLVWVVVIGAETINRRNRLKSTNTFVASNRFKIS